MRELHDHLGLVPEPLQVLLVGQMRQDGLDDADVGVPLRMHGEVQRPHAPARQGLRRAYGPKRRGNPFMSVNGLTLRGPTSTERPQSLSPSTAEFRATHGTSRRRPSSFAGTAPSREVWNPFRAPNTVVWNPPSVPRNNRVGDGPASPGRLHRGRCGTLPGFHATVVWNPPSVPRNNPCYIPGEAASTMAGENLLVVDDNPPS